MVSCKTTTVKIDIIMAWLPASFLIIKGIGSRYKQAVVTKFKPIVHGPSFR